MNFAEINFAKDLYKNVKKFLLTKDAAFDIIGLVRYAAMAQSVEHILGKDEVISSILISSF